VLLAERGLKPQFKPLASYAPKDMPDYALLIGNPAIDFLRSSPSHEIWDLGAAWYELTQLPFVYAVWALRRGVENKALRTKLRDAKGQIKEDDYYQQLEKLVVELARLYERKGPKHAPRRESLDRKWRGGTAKRGRAKVRARPGERRDQRSALAST